MKKYILVISLLATLLTGCGNKRVCDMKTISDWDPTNEQEFLNLYRMIDSGISILDKNITSNRFNDYLMFDRIEEIDDEFIKCCFYDKYEEYLTHENY